MTKIKITDEQYNALKEIFQKLDNDGYTKEERQKLDAEARKNQGRIIK